MESRARLVVSELGVAEARAVWVTETALEGTPAIEGMVEQESGEFDAMIGICASKRKPSEAEMHKRRTIDGTSNRNYS